MGTPNSKEDFYASMNDWAGLSIQSLVRDRFDFREHVVLDVGAGWGKYHFLLPEFPMDAVEVWEPNAEGVLDYYDIVYIRDICNFDFRGKFWDAIIMGDVFEHIDIDQAQLLLHRLWNSCTELFVAIPYEFPQGEEGGNPYEIHKQDDLTPAIMRERYPQLEEIMSDGSKGIYVKRK